MRQSQLPNTKDPHRYDDMLNLPHPVSRKHPQMSRYNRAAQFSPFAALVGYDAEVAEAGRMTDRRIELSESEKAVLDERLHIIQKWIDQRPSKWDLSSASSEFSMPEVSITHFIPDERKDGGAYAITKGTLKKIDLCEQAIVMTDGSSILISNIIAIESETFGTDFE